MQNTYYSGGNSLSDESWNIQKDLNTQISSALKKIKSAYLIDATKNCY